MSKIGTPVRRVDKNHAEIVRKLRKHPDVSVWDIHTVGHGIPDIIVGYHGESLPMEIKCGDGKLNAQERKVAEEWQGRLVVVFSYQHACRELGIKPLKENLDE